MLAISRAFGDTQFKALKSTPGVVTANPDVISETITSKHEIAVIASDGLWDVIGPHQAVNFIRKKASIKESSMPSIVQDLANEALAQGSIDNVTVVLVVFNLPVHQQEDVMPYDEDMDNDIV